MSGLYERVDGGIGFSVAEPCWTLLIRRSLNEAVIGDLPTEYLDAIRLVTSSLADIWLSPSFSVEIKTSIPQHAGLGSKTSLILGVAAGISALLDRPFSSIEAAYLFGRAEPLVSASMHSLTVDSCGMVADHLL
jgi:beta-ribofuranosylaminobenzene 5'-phosphate synthase